MAFCPFIRYTWRGATVREQEQINDPLSFAFCEAHSLWESVFRHFCHGE